MYFPCPELWQNIPLTASTKQPQVRGLHQQHTTGLPHPYARYVFPADQLESSLLQFNSPFCWSCSAETRRPDCSQMLFLEGCLIPISSSPRSPEPQLSPALPPGLIFGVIWRFSSKGTSLGQKRGDRTALCVEVYQLSTQTVQPHSWMRPAAPRTRALIWLGYNTLTESRLLSSLLSLALHLYYFVKVLSTVMLIFYRSEARDYSICFIGPV